ncbi:hypothetical protein, partial [Stenotrophomonas maltophilia]|uniref:hypothetical protein n=1 Tax=Stenotrophomonas maltophilia TaxID=40324 RepID=UPI00066B4F28
WSGPSSARGSVGRSWNFIAAWRAGKRPPEQLSAARHVAREQALPDSVQAELAALNQRKDNGQLSELEYEQQRAKVLSR